MGFKGLIGPYGLDIGFLANKGDSLLGLGNWVWPTLTKAHALWNQLKAHWTLIKLTLDVTWALRPKED